jgi:hypothetical protein
MFRKLQCLGKLPNKVLMLFPSLCRPPVVAFALLRINVRPVDVIHLFGKMLVKLTPELQSTITFIE